MPMSLKDQIANVLLKIVATDHPLRKRLMDPGRIAQGAGVQAGQSALEVGCGRGFFTVALAEAVGPTGYLYALDLTQPAVDYVSQKMKAAGVANMRVFRASALDTGLPDNCVDIALIFGVIPGPGLPFSKLLPEMHRVLRPGGRLAVWTAAPDWSIAGIGESLWFSDDGKLNNVHNFRRK